MPVSPEAEKALPRFVDAVAAQPDLQARLNQIGDIDGLKDFIGSVEPALTGCALVPGSYTSSKIQTMLEHSAIRPLAAAEMHWWAIGF